MFDILEQGECQGKIHDLCLDIAVNIYENTLEPVLHEGANVLIKIIVACGSVAHGLPMSAEDIKMVQARLTKCAIDLNLELPKEFQPEHKLYVQPDANPPLLREKPLKELRPKNHTDTFAHWVEEATSEYEKAAALCAWWISERHQYESRPIIGLLKLGLRCNSVAEDIRRAKGLPTTRNREILEKFRVLHQELKDPSGQGIRISEIKAPVVVRKDEYDALLENARTTLTEFYQAQNGLLPTAERNITNVLWQNFDALDQALHDGKIPENDPHLNALQLFHAVAALCQTFRAPGMRTPPVIELAAELSGLDPLWEWQFMHNHPEIRPQLVITFSLLGIALRVLPFHEIHVILGQLGGHLFSIYRRVGVQLPRTAELKQLLLADHPRYGRASCLLPEEIEDITHQLMGLYHIALQNQNTEEIQNEPAQEIVPPILDFPKELPPEETSRTLPLHVLKVRELLGGRPIILLAGIRKPNQHQALEKALGVKVDWIESDEYDHGLHAESRVKEDTSVVILGVRWMAHAHNGLRNIAREKGVPYVMHPGGLSPSSIAYQILQQAGKQLGN